MRKLIALALFTAIHFTSAQAQTFEIPPHQQVSPVGSFDVWGDGTATNRFETHQEAERHYSACLASVNELTAYSASQVLQVQELSVELNLCLDAAGPDYSGCSDFIDGANGAVWKPVRDDGRGAVFLLPTSYCIPGVTNRSRLSDVRILDKATGEVVTTNHGLRHCNTANQNRLHWNVNLPLSELARYGSAAGKQGFIVEYRVDGERYECREVPNPDQRYD